MNYTIIGIGIVLYIFIGHFINKETSKYDPTVYGKATKITVFIIDILFWPLLILIAIITRKKWK